MVTLVKHEWHQTDRQYTFELDEDILSEIYPDLDEDEIAEMLQQIADGEIDIDEVIDEAYNNDVEIEWDFQYDDCWTDRKGGYEVTYELGDEDSYHTEPADLPNTHKCTKCRWEGKSYETRTQHYRADGTVIEDYYGTDEEADHDKEVCPMCDSDVELTEAGEQEEKERAERKARWEQEQAEWDAEHPEEAVECYSCGVPSKESELITMEGQYICPACGEAWVMPENREMTEEQSIDLENALQELKDEFDRLLQADMQCAQCDWAGTVDEAVENDKGELNCPECGGPIETIE